MKDELEFWLDDKPFTVVDSAFQPAVGDLISIRGKAYRVRSRNFALDKSQSVTERHMRLACTIEEVSQ